MCSHRPPCPRPGHRDRDAARTVAFHPEQGWSLLCNGVIVFDDLGESAGGRVSPRTAPPRPAASRGVTRENQDRCPPQTARAAPNEASVKMIWPPTAMA